MKEVPLAPGQREDLGQVRQHVLRLARDDKSMQVSICARRAGISSRQASTPVTRMNRTETGVARSPFDISASSVSIVDGHSCGSVLASSLSPTDGSSARTWS